MTSITEQAIDPDMRFTPRSHVFLLPPQSAKADLAAGRVPRDLPLALIEKIGRFKAWR